MRQHAYATLIMDEDTKTAAGRRITQFRVFDIQREDKALSVSSEIKNGVVGMVAFRCNADGSRIPGSKPLLVQHGCLLSDFLARLGYALRFDEGKIHGTAVMRDEEMVEDTLVRTYSVLKPPDGGVPATDLTVVQRTYARGGTLTRIYARMRDGAEREWRSGIGYATPEEALLTAGIRAADIPPMSALELLDDELDANGEDRTDIRALDVDDMGWASRKSPDDEPPRVHAWTGANVYVTNPDTDGEWYFVSAPRNPPAHAITAMSEPTGERTIEN